ncbi:hypothetical protein GALL_469770 [mine drainage metagenome]|uniref:Uncharacterized protein n=1 Tax=mine drainage metagenome TaxID=410659 RepID=A0A1J5Q1P4_9ZZZZ
MIDEAAAHANGRFLMQYVGTRREGRARLPRKSPSTREAGTLQFTTGPDLAHVEHQLDCIAIHDVPRVGKQLVLDLRDETRPAEEHEACLAAEHDAQQMIEPGKMIHVRVGDEHVRQPHQLARSKHGDVAQVEQQRAALVAKVDIQARIAECIVDQARFEKMTHAIASRLQTTRARAEKAGDASTTSRIAQSVESGVGVSSRTIAAALEICRTAGGNMIQETLP